MHSDPNQKFYMQFYVSYFKFEGAAFSILIQIENGRVLMMNDPAYLATLADVNIENISYYIAVFLDI